MNLSNFADILSTPWAILLALFFLSASIFVHELGHYLAARWRGLVVERFSIGFGPRVWGWNRKGVDWRISAIPLGGYVALPQLGDMRVIEGEGEQPSKLPKISYTDKVIVAVAGAVFNVLFAFAIGCVLWAWGTPTAASLATTEVGYAPQTLEMKKGEEVPSPAWEAGIRPGDTIVSIDGESVHDWSQVFERIVMGAGRTDAGGRSTQVVATRDGREMTFIVHPLLDPSGLRTIGIAPATPTVVGSVMEDSPAAEAGLQPGDAIVAIDGTPVFSRASLASVTSDAEVKPHSLTIDRAGKSLQVTLTPEVPAKGEVKVPLIGVVWAPEKSTLVRIDPFSHVRRAVETTFATLGALLNPRSDVGLRDISGPVGIINAFVQTAQEGILTVLFLTLLINVNLGIVNLLPIPILDGGHILFATIEKLRHRALSTNVMIGMQNAFVLLLLGLMLYVTYNDIGRLFSGGGGERVEPTKTEFSHDKPE